MRRLLLVASVAAFAWTVLLFATGGIAWHAGPLHLRSRDPVRPLVIACACLISYGILERRHLAQLADDAAMFVRRAAPAFAALAAVVLFVHGIRFGAFVAGSSDAYGYVSQAYAWADGRLPRAARVPLELSWPDGDAVQAPLGYRPGPAPHTIVPTYSPGLPLMMALALRIAGPCGPYLLVPAFAALLIAVTYSLGRHAGGPFVGLAATLLILTSPIVLYQTEWPMSDVPAAALWTTALVSALTPRPSRALLAGAAAALAFLVRSNLLVLAAVPLAVVGVSSARGARVRNVMLYCAPIVPAIAVVAVLNDTWYGSAWSSGYGSASELYSLESAAPNLVRYLQWLRESQSSAILVALVPLVPALRRGMNGRVVYGAYAMGALTLLSYIFYFVFDAWTYVRFLLPALGSIAVLMTAGLVAIAQRLPKPWGHVAIAVLLTAVVMHTSRYAAEHFVFGTIKAQEHRYVDAARFVARDLPKNAVVLAMQHSGSIRFYAGRLTLRYDLLASDWLDRARADLERLGFHPYLLIDDWEIPYVQRQFGLPGPGLPWPLVARMRENGGVSAFDLSMKPAAVVPVALDPADDNACGAEMPLEIAQRR